AVMNRQARAQGFSDATVRRAGERLEIRHIRCEFGPVGLWLWALPRAEEQREVADEFEDKAKSSLDEPPPGPPLRRGGRTRAEPRTSSRNGGIVRRGKSLKGKNGRRKVSESSLPELPNRFG